MQRKKVHRTFLRQTAERLETEITDPLYKGLNREALRSYQRGGILKPLPGSLATGTGVCWTNDLEHALSFAERGTRRVILASNLSMLRNRRRVLDTRISGYEEIATLRLKAARGRDPDPYELWQEILKDDTIIYDGGPEERYTYTARAPIPRNNILYELQVEVRP